jgi:hypothetical protein
MDRSFTRDLRRRGRRLRLSLVPTTGGTQTAYCIGTVIRCRMKGRDALIWLLQRTIVKLPWTRGFLMPGGVASLRS